MTGRGWQLTLTVLGMALGAGCDPGPRAGPLWVAEVTPRDRGADVWLEAPVRVTFSRALDCATAALTLEGPGGPVAGALGCAGSTLTFTPAAPLPTATLFRTAVPDSVRALDGGHLAGPFEATFLTGLPRVQAVTPAADATGVALGAAVTLRFWNRVDCEDLAAGHLRLASDEGDVPGRVACAGAAASFLPSRPLRPGARYTVALRRARDFARNRMPDFSSGFSVARALPATDAAVPDGEVSALALSRDGTRLYLAGAFRSVGPRTGSAVLLDPATGARLPGHALVDGEVKAVLADGRGGWFLGGTFTLAGGQARRGLAHLLPDGTVDPTWRADADGPVEALALAGGRLYLDGAFATVAGQPRDGLAAVDAATGALAAWAPANPFPQRGLPGPLAATGDQVFVGAAQLPWGRWGLAALDAASGQATLLALNGTVSSLATDGRRLYVAGPFTTADDSPRQGLAAYELPTLALADWTPAFWSDTPAPRRAIAVGGGRVYVGGPPGYFGGRVSGGLAAVDAVSGELLAWAPALAGPAVHVSSLAVVGARLVVAGEFEAVDDQPRPGLAAVDLASGALDRGFLPGPARGLRAAAGAGGLLLVGGSAGTLGGEPRPGLAAVDAATGGLLPWTPALALGPGERVCGLTANASSVYVSVASRGGWSLDSSWGLHAFGAAGGEPLPWSPFLSWGDTACALLAVDDLVFVGGDFTTLDGAYRPGLAAVDAVHGQVSRWGGWSTRGQLSLGVTALARAGETLYTVGEQGVATFHLGSGSSGSRAPLAGQAQGVSARYALAADPAGGEVFVGGDYQRVADQPRAGLAAFTGGTTELASWDPRAGTSDPSGSVSVLAARAGVLYAGGSFQELGGAARAGLASLDPVTGGLTGWDPGLGTALGAAPAGPAAMLAGPSRLYLGGAFSSVGGEVRHHLAILQP